GSLAMAPGRVGLNSMTKPTGKPAQQTARNQAPGLKCASAIETALGATYASWRELTLRSITVSSVSAVIVSSVSESVGIASQPQASSEQNTSSASRCPLVAGRLAGILPCARRDLDTRELA